MRLLLLIVLLMSVAVHAQEATDNPSQIPGATADFTQTLTPDHSNQTDDIIISIDWSPDGRWIVTGNNAGDVKIWDANLLTVVQTLSGHTQEIMALSWSPDGAYIASGSPDGSIRIWDVASGETSRIIEFSRPDAILRAINDLDWSPDSTLIAAARESGFVTIWNVNTGRIQATYTHEEEVYTVAWNPLGSLIASGGFFEGKLLIWDMTTQTSTAFIPVSSHESSSIYSITWSPDGSKIAIADGIATIQVGIQVFDFLAEQLLFEITDESGNLISIQWSPAGNQIAGGSFDGTMQIWNAATGEVLEVIEVGNPVFDFAWSPDGRSIAYRDDRNSIEIVSIPFNF